MKEGCPRSAQTSSRWTKKFHRLMDPAVDKADLTFDALAALMDGPSPSFAPKIREDAARYTDWFGLVAGRDEESRDMSMMRMMRVRRAVYKVRSTKKGRGASKTTMRAATRLRAGSSRAASSRIYTKEGQAAQHHARSRQSRLHGRKGRAQ